MIEQNRDSREVMVQITDPVEIANIQENGFHSILGYQTPDGTWWGYKWSVEQYRARDRGVREVDPLE